MKFFARGENPKDIGEAAVSDDGRTGYIDNIRVDRNGQGTGGKILTDLEQQLIAQGVTDIQGIIGQFDDTDPKKLREFYEKHGYKIEDQDGIPIIHKKVK